MTIKLTYFEAHKRASSFLKEQKKDEKALLYVLLEQLHWTKTDWLLNMNQPISLKAQALIKEDVSFLLKDYPPQYILGYAEFFGYCFYVTKDTLIPRPETEELVDLILSKIPNKECHVIDIGTGSGAIAISLKKHRPNWHVKASDISTATLQIAKSNALELAAAVDFISSDVLKEVHETFDVIVSNPPYIAKEESDEMDKSVLKYEPKVALFAKNHGLEIYQKIAEQAKDKLNPNGKIFLEIGYKQARAVKEIFERAFPQKNVRIYKDLAKKDRMLVVEEA